MVIEETGGSLIGISSESWPFTKLLADEKSLKIKTTFSGTMVFKPSDITSIELYRSLFNKGIRIRHEVDTYREKIVFIPMKSPIKILDELSKLDLLNSFISTEEKVDIERKQEKRSFPLKKWFIIQLIVIWNTFFILDINLGSDNLFEIGIGTKLALVYVLWTGIMLIVSNQFRLLALKVGKSFQDIKMFAYALVVANTLVLAQLIFVF